MALFTQKSVKLMGIAGLVVIAVAGGVIVAPPLANSISSQNSDIKSSQDALAALKSSTAKLEAAKSDYPAISKINQQLSTRFPQIANVPGLLDDLTAGAVSSGIPANHITSITFANPAVAVPQVGGTGAASGTSSTTSSSSASSSSTSSSATTDTTPSTSGEFATLEIGISVFGTNRQLQAFLSYINGMDRAIIINGFSVAAATGQGAGPNDRQLSLTGDAFIYKAIETPAETAASGGTASNPAGSSAATSSPSPSATSGN